MKRRSRSVKSRTALLLASTIASLPIAAARAADLPAVTPAPELGWYFYGGFEAGGRFYIERPPSGFGRAPAPENWLTQKNSDSRAKFEEYGAIPEGAFLDWINLQAGTKDGRFAFDFWGRSVGLNNQSYSFDVAELGRHYLSLGWDEIPHLISTSAKNIFGGVGSTYLSVPNSVQAALQAQLPNANATTVAGRTARANIENIINNNVASLDLATQRDRAAVGYRYTPTPDWDFGANYSHEQRTGVRPTAVSWGYANTAAGAAPGSVRPTNVIEIPQPLDDVTQNVDAKAEHAGTTWFGTRWNTNLRYAGSFYDNEIKAIDIENPFCLTCSPFTGVDRGANILRWSPPPSSQANGVTWNAAVDLPFWKSRLVNTVQFNQYTQNDPFVNTGVNGLVMPQPTTLAGVPVNSLDGKVDTLLWNGVYTAQLTKEVSLKLRGRHYNIDNQTPSLRIDNWIWGSGSCATGNISLAGNCLDATTNQRISLPISYAKDNANVELGWRPARWANLGGGFYWERYDRHLRDVNVTDEYSGRVYADFTPHEYILGKVSYLYAQRRYGEYNHDKFVEEHALLSSAPAGNMRKFDIANRNRHKVDALVELTPGAIITVSPNFGMRWDDYPDPVFNPLGVRSDHSWNAGVEIAAFLAPTFKLMTSYNYEDRRLNMANGGGSTNLNTGSLLTGCPTSAAVNPERLFGTDCTWFSDIEQKYHTFMVAADWKVIPSTVDLRAEYLFVAATEDNKTTPCSAPSIIGATAVGTNCNGLATTGAPPTLVDPALVNFGQFPTERNTFQRFNLIGRYYVDQATIKAMGWDGAVTFKARYTAEMNRNVNWASENMTPYVPTADTTELTGASRSLFLAAFNPNYVAHVVALSAVVKW